MKKDILIRNIFEKFTRFINLMYKQAEGGKAVSRGKYVDKSPGTRLYLFSSYYCLRLDVLRTRVTLAYRLDD